MSDKNTSNKITVQAVLDKVKSLAKLKSGFKALASKLTVKVKGVLDSKKVKRELDKSLKRIVPQVKINADMTGIERSIRKLEKRKNDLVIRPTLDNEKMIAELEEAKKEAENILRGIAQIGVNVSVPTAMYEADSQTSTEKGSSVTSDTGAIKENENTIFPDIKETTQDFVKLLEQCNLLEESLINLRDINAPRDISALAENMVRAKQGTKQMILAMQKLNQGTSDSQLKAVGKACAGMSDSQLKAVLSSKQLNEEQRLTILEGMGLADQQGRQKLQTLGLAEAQITAAKSAFSFRGALNAVKAAWLSNPIGLIITAITTGITIFTKVLSYQKKKQEEAAQALKDAKASIEEFQSKIDDMNKKLFDHKKVVGEAKESYAGLMGGVDTLQNKNVNLSTEEFDKFIATNNKLAEMFPELKIGIDEEGNAILDLGDNAQAAAEKLDLLIQKEELANAREVWKNLSAGFDDIYTIIYQPDGDDGLDDQIEKNNESIERYKQILKAVQNRKVSPQMSWDVNDKELMQYYTNLKNIFDNIIDKTDELDRIDKDALMGAAEFDIDQGTLKIDEEEIARVLGNNNSIMDQFYVAVEAYLNEINEQMWALQNDTDNMQEQVDDYWCEYRDDMLQGMIGAYKYLNAENDKQRKIMQLLVGDLDISAMKIIQEEYNGDTTGFLNREVLSFADEIEQATGELGFEFADLFDMSVDANTLAARWEQIKRYFKDNNILINWDLISTDEEIDSVNKEFDQMLWDFNGDGMISAGEELKRYQDSIAYQEELSKLTVEQKKKYMEINQGVYDINEQVKNWREYQKGLKNDTGDLIKLYSSFSKSQMIDALSDMSGGFEQLNKIYSDVKNGGEFDFSSLNSAKFSKNFAGMEEEYQHFIDLMTNSPNDIEGCQKAFDTLIKAWIDSKGILNGVSSATKQLTIDMLEQYGVSNAAAIVEAELARQEAAEFLAKQDLSQITGVRIDELMAEAESVGILNNELYRLMLQEIDFNNAQISSTDKINALNSIANAALGTVAALSLAQYAAEWADYKTKTVGETGQNSTEDYYAQYYKEKLESLLKAANVEPALQYHGKKTPNNAAKSASPAKEKEKEATVETFNFIETLLNRLSSAFEKLKSAGADAFQTLDTRAKSYESALSNVKQQINAQQQAYQTYMEKAYAVGLDEQWAAQVRDGSLNMADVTDDGLKEKIKEYQEWYEKALACGEAVEDLKREQTELMQAKIELLITQYDNLLEKLSGKNDRIQGRIDIKEAWGFSAGKVNYKNMNKNLRQQIAYTIEQNRELENLKSTVKEGSEAWYEYNQRIDANNASLQEMKKTMAENAKAAAALAGETASSKVEKQDDKKELYDAKIDNATTAKQKNKLIDKKSGAIDRQQDAYDDAVAKDKKNLNSAKRAIKNFKGTKENKSLLKSLKKYTKSGKKIPKDFLDKAAGLNDNGKLYNSCVQYNAYLEAYNTDKAAAELFAETSKQEKADLAMEKFDNIAAEYDNQIAADEQKKTLIQNQISQAESQGKKPTTSYYKGLLSVETAEQQELVKKREAMQKSLNEAVAAGSVQTGSEEWYQMIEAINDVTNAIDASTQSVAEYNDQIRQIRWDAFDKGMESAKRLNSETDYYLSLLDKEKMTDDDGNFTDYGKTSLALHNVNYESYMAQAKGYAEEYQELMKAADLSDEKVIQRMRELEDAQRDARLAAEDEKQAIVDLAREGYETQLDSLSDLIQKYKDLKHSEKDAYDYEKTISEKTKNIADLQKQLNAYGNNGTEEAKTKVQKLKVELEEAQRDLEETEYNKYLSDMDNMLDELYTNYERFVNDKLDDTNALLGNIEGLIGNTNTVLETLNGLVAGLGSGGEISKDLADAATGSMGAGEYTRNKVDAEKAAAESAPPAAPPLTPPVAETYTNDTEGALVRRYVADQNPYQLENISWSREETLDLVLKKKQQEDAMNFIKKNVEDAAKVAKNKKKKDFSALNQVLYDNQGKLYKGKGKVLSGAKMKELAKLIGITHNDGKKNGNLYQKLKSLGIKGFADGSRHIAQDQLALTQERGEELIFRSSDSAVFTPLGAGDMVFTDEMSKNLWDISKIPPEELMKHVNIAPVLPDMPTSVLATVNNQRVGDIHIDMGGIIMNGVNDPASFAQELNRQLSSNPQTIGILQMQSVEAVSGSHNYYDAVKRI